MNESGATVREIKPTVCRQPRLQRVAAYARVSSAKDAMHHSLSAQVSYYSNLIQSHYGWKYCGVYADEGITGTKEEREGFQRMLQDCRDGKLDMIITKSISRFARNTVTLLETVRELKGMGIAVLFEEQKINTLSSDGELMLTILAGFAEEESLSVSENMKWRIRKNFEEGKPWRYFMLGYRNKDGIMTIIPAEAEIIKSIYSDYLSGDGIMTIMKRLNENGLKTQSGCAFSPSAITRILQNYAYTGNLMLQKTYRENHLSKVTRVNNGELPMYHATETHDAIISEKTFNAVQKEMLKRREKYAGERSAAQYPFSSLITCSICGKHYRRKVTKSGPVWICSTYNTYGKAHCASKAIPEETLLMTTSTVADINDITGITASEDNMLVFYLASGVTAVKQWKDRSRAVSWTTEMKDAARKKTKERWGRNAEC